MKDPLGIILVMTPPTVSIPKVNGVASIMTNPSVSLDSSPPKKIIINIKILIFKKF